MATYTLCVGGAEGNTFSASARTGLRESMSDHSIGFVEIATTMFPDIIIRSMSCCEAKPCSSKRRRESWVFSSQRTML